jgi:hypothetical protein
MRSSNPIGTVMTASAQRSNQFDSQLPTAGQRVFPEQISLEIRLGDLAGGKNQCAGGLPRHLPSSGSRFESLSILENATNNFRLYLEFEPLGFSMPV